MKILNKRVFLFISTIRFLNFVFFFIKKYNLVILKVYLDAAKNFAVFRTTNQLLINNILYKIRFIDF